MLKFLVDVLNCDLVSRLNGTRGKHVSITMHAMQLNDLTLRPKNLYVK